MLIKRIISETELHEIYRFRHRVLIEECRYLSEKSGTLSDIYDTSAHNYAAFDNLGNIIGVIRLVVDSKIGLPLERLCPLNKYRLKKQLAEACRFAVAKEFRSSRLFIKLIAAAYQCALLIKCTHLVLDTYLEEEPLYYRLGFKRISEPYTDPLSNRNALVVAMMIRVTDKSVSLIRNQAIQNAILSVHSEEIYHGEFANQRTTLEKLPVY